MPEASRSLKNPLVVGFKSSTMSPKRKVLLRNNMTSTTLSTFFALHSFSLFCSSSICFCMFLSFVCCNCSLIASSFHFSMHSLWTSEFASSNMRGFKCQKLLKRFVTNKALPVKWNNLQQKQYNSDSFFEYNNHHLKIWSPFLSILLNHCLETLLAQAECYLQL